jgi:hypothetical protein
MTGKNLSMLLFIEKNLISDDFNRSDVTDVDGPLLLSAFTEFISV